MSGTTTYQPNHAQHGDRRFEPLVSIIIPTYNHGAYLADAINSILEQSYSNVEIIVVDDGSTDNSKEVAASFGDRIHYTWQHNRGLCAARNIGIEAATGLYIGLLDADDMLEADYCSWLVSSLLAFPDAEGIMCRYRFVDELNQPLPQVSSRCLSGRDLYATLLDGNFLVPESMLVHRRCYENAGPFDVTLTACEDWDMWLRISKSHKIICTERILTRHRILSASMSSDPIRMLENRLAVLQKHVGGEPMSSNDGTLVQRSTYGHAYFTTAMEYQQLGDEHQAMKYIAKAASIYPEIMLNVSTFYEVGCSMQPKGSRGYLADLDINSSAKSVNNVLDTLVLSPNQGHFLRTKQRKICAVAFWALSLLAYGAGNSARSRNFLWKVLMNEPSFLLKQDYLSLLAKAILGESGLTQAKNLIAKVSFIQQSDDQTTRA